MNLSSTRVRQNVPGQITLQQLADEFRLKWLLFSYKTICFNLTSLYIPRYYFFIFHFNDSYSSGANPRILLPIKQPLVFFFSLPGLSAINARPILPSNQGNPTWSSSAQPSLVTLSCNGYIMQLKPHIVVLAIANFFVVLFCMKTAKNIYYYCIITVRFHEPNIH